ncbi:Predicted histone tail methylase containing SET domain [Plasmopara halstedii]|uniref:Predicted histone tail methylase containing SET domain n=1 Tax=Plasmopara halstedii TaxID=4781 RepID=A0A0P1AIU7_PLAHL|nr:Predicted histone tail methylase containing SET domain [Plasmopara halstedii]CEG40946.1 Predicted histone tail methylase containing SET domain [Plasmopara halstedii]|eukprot:XP_024577315.1 Predicted histone tail methylase containing SET domain [Plasmopara halstedii]
MQFNWSEVTAYFEALLQTRLHSPPIRCGVGEKDKGKAIFADRAIKAGEPIWTEAPFVAMQHEDNKEFVDCCDNCFVPLIDSKACWARVVSNSITAEGGGALADESTATAADFEAAITFLQKEGGKSPEESYFSVFKLAESQVKCTCGALYCSNTCKDIAYVQHHALLCPRTEERENAMGQFLNHTLVTNEIFQLAAKVIAKILLLFIATQNMTQARQPVDMFCKLPWWEVITSEDDLEESETLEQYRDKFRSLISQTFDYFISGLKENLVHLEAKGELNGLSLDAMLASCADVLNVDFFSHVVGMFEMNNISMEIDHPFHALGEALSAASPEEEKGMPPVLARVKEALEKFTDEHKHRGDECNEHEVDQEHDEEECYALDEDFVGVEGTALFSGICTMNHSCDPNCTVLYTKDGAAHVFAVQDIAEGEELCISYIDVDQEVDEREECLREYQFVCYCPRCMEERKA